MLYMLWWRMIRWPMRSKKKLMGACWLENWGRIHHVLLPSMYPIQLVPALWVTHWCDTIRDFPQLLKSPILSPSIPTDGATTKITLSSRERIPNCPTSDQFDPLQSLAAHLGPSTAHKCATAQWLKVAGLFASFIKNLFRRQAALPFLLGSYTVLLYKI